MTIKARCKFKVSSVEPLGDGEKIKMHTQYDEDDPEDTKFSSATPWGNIEFGLSNPNLVGTFKVGEVYYLDLVPVE